MKTGQRRCRGSAHWISTPGRARARGRAARTGLARGTDGGGTRALCVRDALDAFVAGGVANGGRARAVGVGRALNASARAGARGAVGIAETRALDRDRARGAGVVALVADGTLARRAVTIGGAGDASA